MRGLKHGRSLVLLGIGVLLLATAVGGVTTASRLEEQDLFCTSCHTVPERTYFNRAQAATQGEWPFTDLASAHFAASVADNAVAPFRCIDCHRGDHSLNHRAQTMGLALYDAAIWLGGDADPAIEKPADEAVAPHLLNAGCTTCHTDALLVTGFANHFHNTLPLAYAAWQAGGALVLGEDATPESIGAGLEDNKTTVSCINCHPAHHSASLAGEYLDLAGDVYPSCEGCHKELGRGPVPIDQE